MDELIQRLRQHEDPVHYTDHLTLEAADAIELLMELLKLMAKHRGDEFGFESKLIAAQLDNQRLRETLKRVWGYGPQNINEIIDLALSHPTDTAKADALIARVKELEAEVDNIKQVEFPERVKKVAEGWKGKCETLQDQLTAARAERDAYASTGQRLALELECLLLDSKDTAAVSKWWDSAHEALEQWRELVAVEQESGK